MTFGVIFVFYVIIVILSTSIRFSARIRIYEHVWTHISLDISFVNKRERLLSLIKMLHDLSSNSTNLRHAWLCDFVRICNVLVVFFVRPECWPSHFGERLMASNPARSFLLLFLPVGSHLRPGSPRVKARYRRLELARPSALFVCIIWYAIVVETHRENWVDASRHLYTWFCNGGNDSTPAAT